MYKILNSEKGMTLIELLIALTLLSILSLSVLSFFTQGQLYTSKNHLKLSALNLARMGAERLTVEPFEDIVKSTKNTTFTYATCVTYFRNNGLTQSQAETQCAKQYRFLINSKQYDMQVFVAEQNKDKVYGNATNQDINLYRFVVKVYFDNKELAKVGGAFQSQ